MFLIVGQIRKTIIAFVIIASLTCVPATWADIYRCTDADGGIVYSQIPCPKQKSISVNTSGSTSAALDCRFANRFAFATARLMRAGMTSSEVFNRYGGVDALSKGALGTINYVYGFRTNEDVTVEHIAALTDAKCKARSLGDVNCEALPVAYTESIGGCNAQREETDEMVEQAGDIIRAPDLQPPQRDSADPGSSVAGDHAAPTRSAEITEQCKQRYRDAIDAIEAEMRRGYTSAQGEVYRERLHGLTQQMRRC